MGKKHLLLEDYLSKIPEEYRNNLKVLEKFHGNRTIISFIYPLCGCETKKPLKELLSRKSFLTCSKCKEKIIPDFLYTCDYCKKQFIQHNTFEAHYNKCQEYYNNCIVGIDYVVCSICGFHAKSLGVHVLKEHGIPADEYKKDHQIICSKSHETYKSQNGLNGDWIVRAKENGEDLSEYCSKMGESVRQSILNNPEDRKRRAGVMTAVNKTDVMRKKASETAIKTSARRDIQLQRAEKLQNWRTANPEEFYEKCMSKMFGTYHSIPEKELFNVIVNIQGYDFKSNQSIKSDMFTGKTHRKQIDIGDHCKHVYLEYDGPLHFKETKQSDLKEIRKRDDYLDGYININNFTLIRVSPDQFSYRKSDFGFSTDCLIKINYILKHPTPGVHYIGEMYKDRCKKEEK